MAVTEYMCWQEDGCPEDTLQRKLETHLRQDLQSSHGIRCIGCRYQAFIVLACAAHASRRWRVCNMRLELPSDQRSGTDGNRAHGLRGHTQRAAITSTWHSRLIPAAVVAAAARDEHCRRIQCKLYMYVAKCRGDQPVT